MGNIHVTQRRDERYEFFGKVSWDFFAQSCGKKLGYIANLSRSGCLLKTADAIETRRWIRLMIQDESSNLAFSGIGRVVRRQDIMEIVGDGEDYTLYHHGIEFTYPNYFSLADASLILALSNKNFNVRSCRSLNSRSPFLPGFLA